mmetsp:Transcript_9936/g.41694  ORF Transcript_9936/g.41694 Transcript_9936/m.41694 type:complete len:201 (-) Transcript_9936:1365-1967(-)
MTARDWKTEKIKRDVRLASRATYVCCSGRRTTISSRAPSTRSSAETQRRWARCTTTRKTRLTASPARRPPVTWASSVRRCYTRRARINRSNRSCSARRAWGAKGTAVSSFCAEARRPRDGASRSCATSAARKTRSCSRCRKARTQSRRSYPRRETPPPRDAARKCVDVGKCIVKRSIALARSFVLIIPDSSTNTTSRYEP